MCVTGCPVQVRIPEFIKALREEDMWAAVEYLKDKNSLPAICGRVCPQETQCEQLCVLGRRGEPWPSAGWSALSPIGNSRWGCASQSGPA